MKFHLELQLPPAKHPVNHQSKILLTGSCFTENMGEKLLRHKFNVLQNPHGILFNPVSVCNALESYISNKKVEAKDLFYFNEAYHSWQHHSRFSAPAVDDAIDKINFSIEEAHSFLKDATHLIITLGSAFVYQLTDKAPGFCTGSIAANNHKGPAAWFEKKLMDTSALQKLLHGTVEKLLQFNPDLKIIFTVSPVRHIREGLVENNRSKAVLLQAVHACADSFSQVNYFPAYELVIDDLRDYRFYAEDMVHPNYAATNYVWEKFCGSYFSKHTRDVLERINEINAAMAHKPFNEKSEAHEDFRAKTLYKIKELIMVLPQINWQKEESFFS